MNEIRRSKTFSSPTRRNSETCQLHFHSRYWWSRDQQTDGFCLPQSARETQWSKSPVGGGKGLEVVLAYFVISWGDKTGSERSRTVADVPAGIQCTATVWPPAHSAESDCKRGRMPEGGAPGPTRGPWGRGSRTAAPERQGWEGHQQGNKRR